MRVIAINTLRQFWETHPAAEQAIKVWLDEASQANWLQPADIKVGIPAHRDRSFWSIVTTHSGLA